MERKVSIVEDAEGNRVVVINNIKFRGKRNIDWDEVEVYLRQYVGECCEIIENAEKIYISKDFADEYSGSKDTRNLRGTLAKAKANAAQGIPELVRIAENKSYKENMEMKHRMNAKYGWYRYDSRFALPVYLDNGEIERYNIFRVRILVRHDADGKKYLYDVVNIKKEKRATRFS